MYQFGRRYTIIIAVAIVVAMFSTAFVARVAFAVEVGEVDCYQDDASGTICAGPTVPAMVLSCAESYGSGVVCIGPTLPEQLVDQPETTSPTGTSVDTEGDEEDEEERICPKPVGEGVICTGPDVPENYPPTGQSGQAEQMAPVSYLPLVRR